MGRAKEARKEVITSRTLGYIPSNVLYDIASYTDLQSAINLARTCKSLRDAGEIRIWEELDFTYIAAKRLAANDNENRRLHRKQLAGILVALREYPVRVGYVKHAVLSPDTPYPPYLDLLKLLAPHLRSLRFLPCPQDGRHECQVSRQLYSAMTSADLDFTLLSHLELNITYLAPLVKLFKGLPVLVHLTLTFRGVDGRSTTDHTDEGRPTIRHPSIANLVLKVASIPSEVDIVTIRDTFGAVAGSLEKIDRLLVVLDEDEDWSAADIRKIDHLGLDRFTTAAKQSMLISSGSEAAGYYGDWVRGFDEMIIIGAGVDIREQIASTIHTAIPIMAQNASRIAIQSDSGIPSYRTPETTESWWSTRTAEIFTNRPNLFQVQLSCSPEPSSEHSALALAGSHDALCCSYPVTWIARRHSGIILRSYRSSSSGSEQVSRAELYHARILSKGDEASWWNQAAYKGYSIPISVLSSVYDQDGMGMDWTSGERGLILSDSAWDILESYINRRGQAETSGASYEYHDGADFEDPDEDVFEIWGDDIEEVDWDDGDELEDDYLSSEDE